MSSLPSFHKTLSLTILASLIIFCINSFPPAGGGIYVNPAYDHADISGESQTDDDHNSEAPWLDTRRAVLVKRHNSSRREWLRDAGIVLAVVLATIALAVAVARGGCDCGCCSRPTAGGGESYATHADVVALNRTLIASSLSQAECCAKVVETGQYATQAELATFNQTVTAVTSKVTERLGAAEREARKLCDALYENKALSASVELVQEIDTSGARDWEAFTVNSTSCLAVANQIDGNSYIYRHSSTSGRFEVMQELDTNSAMDWEAFTLDGVSYLAVANYKVGNTRNVKSRIYRYSVISDQFEVEQQIDTNGARDWEAFVSNGTTYLVVANESNDTSYNIMSRIYRYSETSGNFTVVQEVDTTGAFDWEAFTLDGNTYLALANYYDGSTYNLQSHIYRYSPISDQFEMVQAIDTHGAVDCEALTIDGDAYLVFANSDDDLTSNIMSRIYRQSPVSDTFELLQEVDTSGAYGWEAFTVNGATYLAVANYHSDGVYNIKSRIFRYSATSDRFDEVVAIDTNGAVDWRAFTLNGTTYLAVANLYDSTAGGYNLDSHIYRFKPPC